MPRRFLIHISLALAMLLPVARPASAQSADDLFNAQVIQEIRLQLNSRDLRDLRERYGDDTYYTADFQWRTMRVRNVGVRSRGGASRNGVKLGLRVDFDRYTTGQTFLGQKSLVLKNLWQDGSFMHERLAMAFFARMGQPASRESFCRLYINNEFQGLYAIVESVDKNYLTRTTGEDAGYLFDFEQVFQFRAEDLGDDLAPYKSLFKAETHEKEADNILYSPIRNLFREVNGPDDNVWRDRVEQYVDLTQFMTQAAIENFLAEDDGLLGANGMNNFYFYRPGGSNRHRFLPWDKDNSFLLTDYPILLRVDDNAMFRRAFAFGDLRDVYFQVLEASARSAAEDGWLEAEIVSVADLIAPVVAEDTRKPFSTEAFFESVEILRAFARDRPGFVLQQIERAR
jgi:spore coat protein CotH